MLKKIIHKFISVAIRGLLGISGPSRATTRTDLIESNLSDALETLLKKTSITSLVSQGRPGSLEVPATDIAI